MSAPVATPVRSRFFLGAAIPPSTRALLRASFTHFPQHIDRVIPVELWHLTMVFLGDIEATALPIPELTHDLPQVFVPTIQLTHVGRGLQRDHVWAYAHPSTTLVTLRTQLLTRLEAINFSLSRQEVRRAFVPHIHLANLFPMTRSVGMADHFLNTAFALKEIHLYRSARTKDGHLHYAVEGTIRLIA